MEILLLKTPQGALIPATEDEAEKLRRFRVGATVRAEISTMRNGQFFRKWWALAKIAYDLWSETVPEQEYKGVKVLPDFDRFRRDLIIMAGFYRPVFAANGECRLEPESLKWSRMSEERFDKLYSATINVVLQKILKDRGFDEQRLREWVDRVMEFT